MTDKEQKKAAKDFAERWEGKGYEKGQSQQFWIDLLVNVFGVKDIAGFISFEDQVMLDHTSFIDGYIDSTHVMIEQKSLGKDLRKGIKQSDGSMLSPFQQAKRYAAELPYSKRPRWIITCNFAEFLVYDMEKPNGEPEQILLKDLAKEYYRLGFIVDTANENIKKEMEISLKAGELVGKLYDAILRQYADPNNEDTLKSLNKLCVRLVFCLYAEDADIFGKHQMFHDYMKRFSARDFRKALIELFQILDTKPEDRDPYLDDDLAAFPYVNGGLFADEHIEIPRFTEEIIDILLRNASEDFDWSGISPTIFGAVFESTLNPETRRSGGMHYTSIENIHKVIDPLFLDELHKEFEGIKDKYKVDKTKKAKIEEFRDKLASLTFLDPACGSGNFLTQTYIELRRLENEALQFVLDGQMMFDIDPIKVNISQFYGIEINDFAVTVAKTALWIAEAQMLQETEKIVERTIPFLPLKSYANITEGNALRIDWESIVSKDRLSYIMGNPPFVGVNYMSDSQREDMDNIWIGVKRGKLDYVTCWYVKAADIMKNTEIRTALVSTNSVSQGEQVSVLWKKLFDEGIHIDFAHRTFIWDSEASLKAHVHCVIIGFSYAQNNKNKYIYSSGSVSEAKTINGYLLNAPVVVIEERSKPLCDVPAIVRGSQATDDGYYLFTPEEKNAFVAKEPQSEKFFKRFMMGREFINNIERWCLWIPDISPKELKSCPEVMKRVQAVKELRLASKNKQTQQAANIPWRFGQYRPPAEHFIAFAKVSSEHRRYIPFGFLNDDIIPGDKLFTIPNATLYLLGVLTSNVHMAWMRTVCGRLKSDYSYSTTIVYNNFPWCTPTDEQKARIEQTAQAILDARALYPDCSLADLYDETTMPPELRKAHQANDLAVMAAYAFDKKITESECVAELMKMYQKLTEKK
ncbi:DNA methyltransferase [Ruminococcus sp. XPD3002]|uniref:DNA methyltransferase n=1 Tax=Ruminococcus sp. XPD3002 TaxID=1452269 RepID=UPI00091C3077|nr:Methyltransferase domain-containing protein [Ruminococcus flavefaciens]